MSWWPLQLDKAVSISKIASSALKEAQRKIDSVLDIQDEEYTNLLPELGYSTSNDMPIYIQTTATLEPEILQIFSSGSTQSCEADLDKSLEIPSSLHVSTPEMSASETLVAQPIDMELLSSPSMIQVLGPESSRPSEASSPIPSMPDLAGEFETGTTTSSDIEVISSCTSGNDEAGYGFHCPHGSPLAMVTPPLDFFGDLRLRNTPSRCLTENMLIEDRKHTRHARSVNGSIYRTNSVDERLTDKMIYEHISQKLSDAQKIINAREAKLVEICRENSHLQEENVRLNNLLEETVSTELIAVKNEYSHRLSASESRLRGVCEERDKLRYQLSTLSSDTSALHKKVVSRLEALLGEKEVQIAEIMKEGEKMAQDQLKANNLVKKFHARLKEAEALNSTQSDTITKIQLELVRMKTELEESKEAHSRQTEKISYLSRTNFKLEKQLASLKENLERVSESNATFRHNAQVAEERAAEVEQLLKQSEAGQAAADARIQQAVDGQERHQALDQLATALQQQVHHLQLAALHQKRQHERRREEDDAELAHCRAKLAEAESRCESLSEADASVAGPLLRQIACLQGLLAARSRAWEELEEVYRERIETALQDSSQAAAREEACLLALAKAEQSYALVQTEASHLCAQSEGLRNDLLQNEALVNGKQAEIARLQTALSTSELKLAELTESLRSNQSAYEAEKAINSQLTAQLEHFKSLHVSSQQTSPDSTRKDATRAHKSVNSVNSSSTSLTSLMENECTDGCYPKKDGMQSRMTGPLTSSVDFLQASLHQREGEVAQLRRDIQRLSQSNEMLLSELEAESSRCQRFAQLVGISEAISLQLASSRSPSQAAAFVTTLPSQLSHRYEVLLQLYGEKLEENSELRMDLEEATAAYKSQIELLLAKKP